MIVLSSLFPPLFLTKILIIEGKVRSNLKFGGGPSEGFLNSRGIWEQSFFLIIISFTFPAIYVSILHFTVISSSLYKERTLDLQIKLKDWKVWSIDLDLCSFCSFSSVLLHGLELFFQSGAEMRNKTNFF